MSVLLKTNLSSHFCEKHKFIASILLSVYKKNALVTDAKIEESTNESDTVIDIPEYEEETLKIRNKSRLKQEHRNILFNKKPHTEPRSLHHLTIRYNRKLYGKYGSESGVNPGIMWPTKVDLELRKEYESVAYPSSIQEMVNAAKKEIEMKELAIMKQQEQIEANLAKLDNWNKELKQKIAKKEAEALAAKEKKDKLIEDVRRHFGYTVDVRDEKFKEMLALKEKEQRKKDKQARSEEREKKAIAKLMEKNKETLKKNL